MIHDILNSPEYVAVTVPLVIGFVAFMYRIAWMAAMYREIESKYKRDYLGAVSEYWALGWYLFIFGFNLLIYAALAVYIREMSDIGIINHFEIASIATLVILFLNWLIPLLWADFYFSKIDGGSSVSSKCNESIARSGGVLRYVFKNIKGIRYCFIGAIVGLLALLIAMLVPFRVYSVEKNKHYTCIMLCLYTTEEPDYLTK